MASQKKAKSQIEEPQQQVSSSLDYLDADSKHENVENSKRQEKDEPQKQLQQKKSKQKQKQIQNDISVEDTFLYKPDVEMPNIFHLTNQQIKVIISAEYLTKNNPSIIKRNIYGTDTYTSKSDCLCIAIHAGFVNISTFQFKRYEGIQMYMKVIKPKKNYVGSLKNGLLSRSTKQSFDNSLKPQNYKPLTSLPKLQSLQKFAANMYIPIGKKRFKSKPKNLKEIVPIPEAHLVYNLNSQPAHKYTIFNIADKGYDKDKFMIKKLDTYVLYLQTKNGEKYEIVKGIEGEYFEVYKLSKLKVPKKFDNLYFYENPAPVSETEIEVIEENLEWEQIAWGNTYLRAKDHKIDDLTSFKYYKKIGK